MCYAFFEQLTDLCQCLLYKDSGLFNYLKDRGLSSSTIWDWRIGAFPTDLRILLNNMNKEELLGKGIIWNASNSPFLTPISPANNALKIHYPIVIPIFNAEGKPVAIGCRTLINDDNRREIGIPKYRNSSYEKTAYLFGLDRAIGSIREHDRVYVVEGYFDVIACHQAGIRNVVATCGTMFSWRQLTVLSRYTDNIVLLFDNDDAGRMSSERVLSKLNNNPLFKVNLSSRCTPDGYKDIDEYLSKGGDICFFNNQNGGL